MGIFKNNQDDEDYKPEPIKKVKQVPKPKKSTKCLNHEIFVRHCVDCEK